MNTDAALGELYGLQPERFIVARDHLAKAVRTRDDRAAAGIMALRKPTIAAWLANQLVRVDPDGVHALTELGEQLRETYLSTDSARRRELTRQRHDLVAHLVQVARTSAAGGRRVTAQTAERLTETLDAALVDPAAAQLLRTGQLTSALRHVGFGVVDESNNPAPLAPARPGVVRRSRPPRKIASPKPTTPSSGAHRRIPQDIESQRVAEGRSHHRAPSRSAPPGRGAEADYAAALTEHEQAEQLLDTHQHRIADLEADLVRLNDELEQTRQAPRAARKQLPHLQRSFRRAERHAAAVQSRRDAHQQRLTALDC